MSQQNNQKANFKGLWLRVYSSVLLFGLLFSILYIGYWAIVVAIVFVQVFMVKELYTLLRNASLDTRVPYFKYLQWYFFVVTMFALYTSWLKPIANIDILQNEKLAIILLKLVWKHNLFVALAFYMLGFVIFIIKLNPDLEILDYQYKQFMWTHMIMILLILPSSFYVQNIMYGQIWFSLPIAVIIANDSFAYFAGRSFGRTPLISISPRKTWEGFFGGFLGSIVVALTVTPILSKFNSQICPKTTLNIFSQPIIQREACQYPPQLYQTRRYHLNELVELVIPRIVYSLMQKQFLSGKILEVFQKLGNTNVYISPMMIHALFLALFASLVAPFGGYFASGLKRVLRIKDFGKELPGHGGLVDRFDCITIMGLLSNMYLYSVINQNSQYQVFQTASYVIDQNNVVCTNPGSVEDMFALLIQQAVGEGQNISSILTSIPKEKIIFVANQLRQCFQ